MKNKKNNMARNELHPKETELILSIIIMAFNEENSLGQVFEEIKLVLLKTKLPFEIIIINDGSSDGTAEIAKHISLNNIQVRVINHKENKGLGEVYRTGFFQSKGRFVSFFPADGQFPANIIEQFIPLMTDNDMALGYLPNRDSSILAKSLSKIEKLIYRLLFGSFPEFQGVTMFKHKLLDEINLQSSGRGWAVLMELVIKAQRGNYKVISSPTEMRPRMSGKSKVNNLQTIWANLQQILILRRYL